MVRDRAMRDDVGFGPLPVVSHSGVFDGSGASAGRLACVLAVAGLLCVSSAQGQVIREEGFPVKGGVPEESAWAPVVREECDPFTVPGEFGESCAPREKTPDPFGFGPEGKARPGEPSGPVWRTPPRLECPVAIFLEELETGQVECHAWDASGEEYLEYSWEPVGSTTRDYLDNPRLTPEDVPNPSVVAPETPSYETLESFYSGETTFLYRYRLTATSRATGLSSWREVEVYVSGSRPSVYCPLEVSVEEGEAIALDCEGVDPLSHRMDYDEDGASILWEWEGLWGTSMAPLAATDLSSPLFTAPAGSAGEEYHYIASMTSQASGTPRTARRRVTVRVVGGEAVGDADSSAGVTCDDSPYSVYEGAEDLLLDCDGNGPFNVNVWLRWSRLGEQVAPPQDASSTPKLRHRGYDAIFDAPDSVDADEIYEYTIAIWTSPGGPDPYSLFASDDVRITVLNKPAIDVDCAGDPYEVYEGAAGFTLDCSVTDEPTGATYEWGRRGSTSNTNDLSSTTILRPTFSVPADIDEPAEANKDYEYTVTMSVGGVEQASKEVTVTVLEKPDIWCSGPTRGFVANGSATDFPLHVCKSGWRGAPAGSDYAYAWTARNGTPDTRLLNATNIEIPLFDGPEVENHSSWYYRLTVSAENADDASVEVTVSILAFNTDPVIDCNDAELYEGAADITLDCSVTDEPSGATYAWTGTDIANRLSSSTILKPTFDVPDNVDADTDYEYTVTLSASGIDDVTEDVTVKVLNKRALSVACAMPSPVYEGSEDFALDCAASGAPRGSSYTWSWSPNTRLTDHDTGTPTFAVPGSVEQDTTYTYAVTATAENADDETANVTVTVLDTDTPVPSLAVNCQVVGTPSNVSNARMTIVIWEKLPDPRFACEVTDAPENASYVWSWTASTGMTNLALLSADDIPNPFFDVPDIDGDERHEYIVTATSDVGETGKFFVDITVREWGDISVTCTGTAYDVPEGADTPDFAFDCRADGSLVPPYTYTWSWSPTDRLTDHDTGTPTFDVPEDVDRDTTYVYTATVTSLFSDAGRATVEVTVRDTDTSPPETPGITCIDPDPVYEGADDITLDCSVTDEPSGATYAWTGTDIANRLSSSTILKPAFDVPDNVDADTDYEYTVTLSASGIDDVTEDVTVKVLNKRALSVACATPSPVYEGSEDFALDCAASGAPAGSDYAYEWTARGGGDTSRLSSTTVEKPTFEVPEEVDATTTYEYLLTVSAANAEDATAEVTVTVLNRGALAVICADPGSVYEGSEDFAFDCSASGAPAGSDYAYEWTARGSTANTDLLIAGADGPAPTFDVPEEVDATTTYEYLLTASAENAEDARAEVTVTVLNRGALSVVCVDPPSVYEGSEDFALDCSASGAPAGSDYAYEWTARGSTPNTFRLSAADIASPTFYVPDALEETTTYEYLLTARAENAEDARAEVTVTVLNRGALAVICADPGSVYEGSEDVAFDCAASGAPAGSGYTYAWTARNSTANTDLLVAGTDGPAPTFAVPEEVDEDETYEYTLTVSAENAESARAEVTVKVLNLGSIALVCASPPLVYEGSADFALDCSISGDTGDNVDYTYEWTAIGSTTNTDLLSAADIASPTFYVPEEVDATTTYEYLLTARAANAEDATAEVTVTVLNRGALAVICADPGSVYEGSEDFALDCTASGAPAGSEYTYEWTGRGSTTDTALLSAADIASPTFYVPEEVAGDETYEYRLTVSAENAEDATAEVTVTVLNRGALAVICTDPGSVYEGSEDFALDCAVSGAPAGSAYEYAWTVRGSTANTDLLISGVDGPAPTFDVPEEVDEDETYEYLLTASAENAESASAEVTVTVLNRGALALACADPGSVYEGSEDFAFDCSASGAPAGSDYAYEWTARGSTANTDLLIASADGPAPTFDVPEEVEKDETYKYLLTVSAENAESATAEVTVKVLNLGSIALVCASPPLVYEGSEDFALDCSISGDTGDNVDYAYAWTARGSTTNTDLLSGADIPSPTFHVPDALDETTTYEYLLTVSAENAESAAAEVSVTVLNKGALALVCADPGSVYEGSADIAFDCSASGAPAGSAYVYSWIAQGATPNTSRLSAVDIPSPTFYVPDEVAEDETYEYLLTASAENAESATAEVTVTVLNRGALALACADPGSVYEGSADIAFDCSASGAPAGSAYVYSWIAQGATPNTSRLSAVDIPSPTFYVPDEVAEDETYEYLLTVSAENAIDASADVTVTVLNRGALALACADPGSVYEGSEDVAFDCTASGAPAGSAYEYAWTARGSTTNTALLSAADVSSPMFYVPEEVEEDETYEYLLTVSAENAESGSAEVTVTVLNRGALSVVCVDPPSVYEGSEDFALDCSASGAPAGSAYEYAWTARGSTTNTALLSATDVSSPTFYVPEEVEEDETYEYLLAVSAANAESGSAEVTVTVLDRIRTPAPDPVSPPAEEPPVAGSSSRAPSDPTALGVTVSASPLRFGVQSSQTEASLDPMTDQISTRVSGPYHAGRMTLSPGGDASFDENGEMDLSIEVVAPVLLKREGAAEPSSLVLSPSWSFAESCEQLSSQAIGGLYTEATLTEGACRLLRFGGELDLTGAPSGRYAGAMDVVLRSGEREETHSVEVEVTVVPSQRVITIGPGGVRFSTSREVPAGLTEDQSLSIYPDVAFLTEGKPNGAFELSNPSLIPLEVSVSARFGYTEATEDGREVVVEDASDSRLGDLSQVVDIHPGVLVLQPGEKGLIRYGVQEGALAAMEEQGYAAFFDVVSSPRQYVRTDRMPEEVTGERTARVTMRVPGVYVPGEGASQLRATLLSLSYGVSMSATFLVETQDRPFAGEVVAYDGQGRELGRRETLVYTRSRVRVPLDRMPEEEVVFLRFSPRGPGRVPDPVNIPWNAPGRDIGAAGEKERRTIPKSALQ